MSMNATVASSCTRRAGCCVVVHDSCSQRASSTNNVSCPTAPLEFLNKECMQVKNKSVNNYSQDVPQTQEFSYKDPIHFYSSTPLSLTAVVSSTAKKDRHDHIQAAEMVTSTIHKERKTPSVNVHMTLLPAGFAPTECDVLCGRGRVCKDWKGNVRYRELVDEHMKEYSVAKTKLKKGVIISAIVDRIRNQCLHGRNNCPNHTSQQTGGFVKFDIASKRWYEVGDFLAREKTSQIFRDALYENYSSSAQAKYRKRRSEHRNGVKTYSFGKKKAGTNPGNHFANCSSKTTKTTLSISPPQQRQGSTASPPLTAPEIQPNSDIEIAKVLQSMAGYGRHALLSPHCP